MKKNIDIQKVLKEVERTYKEKEQMQALINSGLGNSLLEKIKTMEAIIISDSGRPDSVGLLIQLI